MILEILDIQPASQITRYKIRIDTSLKHRVSCETDSIWIFILEKDLLCFGYL